MLSLILKIVDFDPDLLIIFDGINDWGQFHLESRVGYPYLFSNLEKAILPFSFSKLFRNTVRLSSFAKYFRRFLLSTVRDIRSKKSDNQIEKEYKSISLDTINEATFLFINNHIKMQKICDSYNINCIHINQPNATRKDYLTKSEFNSLKKYGNKYCENILLMETEAINRFKSLKKKNSSFLFYDFGDIFDDEEQTIYFDICHFVDLDYSNNKIAQEIEKIIIENNLFGCN